MLEMIPEFSDDDCLRINPFEGDFGSPGDRVLKDKIGVARKAGACHCCGQQIQPGERVRMRAEISDGDLISFRWCRACCYAMAKAMSDNGEAWEARAALRRMGPNAEVTGA